MWEIIQTRVLYEGVKRVTAFPVWSTDWRGSPNTTVQMIETNQCNQWIYQAQISINPKERFKCPFNNLTIKTHTKLLHLKTSFQLLHQSISSTHIILTLFEMLDRNLSKLSWPKTNIQTNKKKENVWLQPTACHDRRKVNKLRSEDKRRKNKTLLFQPNTSPEWIKPCRVFWEFK